MGSDRATASREAAAPAPVRVAPVRTPVSAANAVRAPEHATAASSGRDRLAASLRASSSTTAEDPRAHGLRRRRKPIVQTKLAVSRPGDALEREADAVSSRVLRGARPKHPSRGAAAGGPLHRSVHHARGPPSLHGQTLPHTVTAVVASPGGGRPLDAAVRAQIEPHVGIDLGHVRVRTGDDAARASRDLNARAFASGSTIYLAPGASELDVGLMAHEATHVAQQDSVAAARSTLMRAEAEPEQDTPGWLVQRVKPFLEGIPGYALLTYITGTEPLTGAPVNVDPAEMAERLLTTGPFGAAFGPVLRSIAVLGDVVSYLREQLVAHRLTLSRVAGDLAQAWSEFTVGNLVAGNLAIVKRYVGGIFDDVKAFAGAVSEHVIELARGAAVGAAEPLLAKPAVAPVWSLAKKVLRRDPLRDVEVKATTAEILADFLTLRGEEQRLTQMRERGTLQQTADWIDTQLGTFAGILTDAKALFADAWAAISPGNLANLLDDLDKIVARAIALVGRIADFAIEVLTKVLAFVKQALLGWLSEHAHTFPGFHLLTVVLGENPFTHEVVPPSAENLIKGFITLLPDGEAVYDELSKTGVVGEAATKIEAAVTELDISVASIGALFSGIWNTLSLDDLLKPLVAFDRVLAQFGAPLARLVAFVTVVVEVMITLVLRLMNFPTDLLGNIIGNAKKAIVDIKRDPVGFLKNMLEALKLGLNGFFDNIGTYLAEGLGAWMFRGLGKLGIKLPADYSLGSIIGLVLQVLGITADAIWLKIGKHIGDAKAQKLRAGIAMAGQAFAFMQEVADGGIGVIWTHLAEKLSGLWDSLLGMAKDWIVKTLVSKIIAKLVTMLDPTGVMAVVNSVVAFFNAVQSAIEYIREILEIVDRYVTTFAQVAAGNVVPGAQMLEQGLAKALPVGIGFLANQVGLGNIPEQIVALIERLRALVDAGLDWLIGRAVGLAKGVLDSLGLGGGAEVHETFEVDGEKHHLDSGKGEELIVSSEPQQVDKLDVLKSIYTRYAAAKRAEQQRAGSKPGAATPTAVSTSAAAIIQELIALIKQHPEILRTAALDPPNLGAVGPHSGNAGSALRPAGGGAKYAAAWELESEHIVSRGAISASFVALGWDGMPAGGPEYNAMTTIVLYRGAANLKTYGDGDISQMAAHRGAVKSDADEQSVFSKLAAWAVAAVKRTKAAIKQDYANPDQLKARGRKAGDPAKPIDSLVDAAYAKQWAEIEKHRAERKAASKTKEKG